MTDCFSSPHLNRFGLKRLSSGDCYGDKIGDVIHSENPFKRTRNSDFNSFTSGADQNGDSQNRSASNHPFKRTRNSDFNSFTSGTDQNGDSQNRSASNPFFPTAKCSTENILTESCRRILKAEFQHSSDQKDADILSLRSTLSHQDLIITQTQAAKAICEEENRILKRAVAIQDGRQKELTSQNHQLQAVLAQAAEHIANLERNSEELRKKIDREQFSFSHSNFGNRFPDVF